MKRILSAILLLLLVASESIAQKFNVDTQLRYCHGQVLRSLKELSPIDYTKIPRNIGADEQHWNLRNAKTAEEWCSGFWPGILWMTGSAIQESPSAESDEMTIIDAAAGYTAELEFLAHQSAYDHDLGFQMIGSFLKGYEYLPEGSSLREQYKKTLLNAADTLATLFNEKAGTILSWPRNIGMFGGHNTIMDNMINLELLFWASNNGGGRQLYDIATKHALTTMRHHFRKDGSINHVAVYDINTGKHLRNCNHQGFNDESLWSRGQSWAIYGYTMVYRFTHDKRFLRQAIKSADIMLSQLPDDGIPYWDMRDPKIPNTYRDASAAAVIADALIELSGYVTGKKSAYYMTMAEKMLATLSSPEYLSESKNPAFLMHSVGNLPAGSEIDYSINYADYYYIEALLRLKAKQP